MPLVVRQTLAIAAVEEAVRREREGALDLRNPRHLPALFGLPVELGDARPASWSLATWITAAVISAVSIAAFASPQLMADLAMVPDRLLDRAGLPALTVLFVHANWWHLLGNVYFLLLVGDDVEELLGWQRWLLLLLAATVAGSLLQAAFDPRGDVPCVGASGGISGLLAFYGMRLPEQPIGMMVFQRLGFTPRWIVLSARGCLWLWLAAQLLLVSRQLAGVGAIAGLAHVGGAAVGIAAHLLTRQS